MSESAPHNWMASATTPELEDKLLALREHIADLTINLKNLLSGGCVLEALLDEAEAERGALKAELGRRGT